MRIACRNFERPRTPTPALTDTHTHASWHRTHPFAVGSRISDSSENLFADDQTLWACGYVDQQVPGMMYLGEATDELNESAKSGTLAVTL